MPRTQVGGDNIADGTITNADISASAAIASSKLSDGANFVKKDGSVALTANLNAGGFKVTNLGAPSAASDAATKAYADALTPTPAAHKTSHENGGGDEISVAGLSGLLADPQTALSHAASHQNGGGDEISVLGLSGLLADPQTPTAHASSHATAGGDPISLDSISPTTTKGDLLVRNASNLIRIPVGTNGQALVADSAQASGVKWATLSFAAAGANADITSLTQGANVFDITNGLLKNAGITVMSIPAYQLFDVLGDSNLQFGGRQLRNSVALGNNIVLQWETGYLGASNGSVSVQFYSRELKRASTVTSVDYENSRLKGNGGQTVLEWTAQQAFDQFSVLGLDWGDLRTLNSSSGAAALTWLTGDIVLNQLGKGLRVKEGANAKQGVATLVAGTVTVSNTSVTANSRILYSVSTAGGTQGILSTTQSAGASFTINSTSVLDTSTVVWEILEPS